MNCGDGVASDVSTAYDATRPDASALESTSTPPARHRAILTGEGTRTHTGTNEEQMRVRDAPYFQIDARLVLVPPALRGLHRRVPLHFKVDLARLAAVRAAVPLGVDVDADDRVLGNHFHVDVLAAPTAIRVRRLRLNTPLEERHDVV